MTITVDYTLTFCRLINKTISIDFLKSAIGVLDNIFMDLTIYLHVCFDAGLFTAIIMLSFF